MPEVWWRKPGYTVKRGPEPCWYLCWCPRCEVPFTVPEDLPDREEDYFGGVDVFVVYCPVCGQKLRFSIDDTPTIENISL